MYTMNSHLMVEISGELRLQLQSPFDFARPRYLRRYLIAYESNLLRGSEPRTLQTFSFKDN